MRPLWSYYGSKWRGAKHYGPPRHDLVTEPFAGSACYSLFHEHPRVRLYDRSDDVCHCWDFLTHCSEEDIRRIPDGFERSEDWAELPDGPRQLVFWNVKYADARVFKALPEWYLHFCRTGEKTGPMRKKDFYADGRPRDNRSQRYWGHRMKCRLISALPLIRGWTIERASYEDIPLETSHWFVDPPYQGQPGKRYPHNRLDHAHLAEWCRNLPGPVDVCERDGADWLPFEPLFENHASRSGKRVREVVWRKERGDLFG